MTSALPLKSNLERFLLAQDGNSADEFLPSYSEALAELNAGQKESHWIWYIFPQLRGLGSSYYSTFYGLTDEEEALEYLNHPILGARYVECVDAVFQKLCPSSNSPSGLNGSKVTPLALMGSEVDVLKLKSSLQLFDKICRAESSLYPIHSEFHNQIIDILQVIESHSQS